MLKLCGICLVIGGCTGIGWYMVCCYASRIHILMELERILHYLYGEIEYSGCDMIEILDKLVGREGHFQKIWEELTIALRKNEGTCFTECWKEALGRSDDIQRNMTGEDKEMLIEIGENLGNLDRNTQLHTLEIFQERVQERICQTRVEYRERAKVSLVTGVTAGLLLTLVLL